MILKQWLALEALRQRVTFQCIQARYYRQDRYPNIKLNRVNPRVLIVLNPDCKDRLSPSDNEVTLKQWVVSESERDNVSPHAIHMRIQRGKYPNLILRKINRRVIFVRTLK